MDSPLFKLVFTHFLSNGDYAKYSTSETTIQRNPDTYNTVAKMFVEEQPALIPLPKNRFANFHEGRRTVHRDGHVAVEQAFYSVPPEYVGRNVWVRWDANLVRIYDHQFAPLIVHAKGQPGQCQTASEHIPWHKVSAVERNANTLLSQLAWVGPQTQQWSEAVVQARGVAAIRVLIGLKSLTQDHANEAIEKACKTALSYGAYRLQTIRQLLKRQPPPQQAFEFLEEHPIIRPLKDYSLDSILQFRKERP